MVLPPVTVFYDGSEYWLADGFHRYRAHEQIEWREIDADVRQGTRRDAILYSVGANSTHGLRRTNADKRRAVETLLRDAEWQGWVDTKIARQCGVSSMFVGNMRRELDIFKPFNDSRTVERNGTTYTQNTANIGKRPTPANPPSFQPVPVAPPTEPAPWPPPHDPETGEVLAAAPPFDLPERIPNEVYDAGRRTLPSDTPYTVLQDALQQAGHSEQADALSRALSRVLEFEREAPAILATSYAQQMGIYRLARELRDLLNDWLEVEPTNARGGHVITLEAEPLLT
ncbi:hypothetical protein DEIPH_ctg011orf0055 [Deinococcus phoenicis]|uniref:ParB/Sulfiredoxin domain-containing protein n=1 Tax=Deinococcus phoenicis TaxID=1476583 RepID=A0A016QTA3_9DEIO|nr:hypothetical protein DEIPH_ctg011orf0055 [Deinococcus phoenicis]